MSHAHAITFDTLAFVKKLETSGIEHKQSEGITEAMAGLFETSFTALATKADIRTEIHRLDTKIDKLALRFDGKLSKLESKLVKWVVGAAFAQITLLSTIVFAIIKFMH